MKQLEGFIRENRDSFDSELPSDELWGKIEDKLNKNTSKRYLQHRIVWAVAAILVVALITTILVEPKENAMERFGSNIDPEMKELLETEAYYAVMVSGKMTEIERCYQIYPELKSDIEADLQELDLMYKELKNDLNDNFYNREVIEAMIQNNRVRLEMVNRVLDQINC
jgi:hypothetical protein